MWTQETAKVIESGFIDKEYLFKYLTEGDIYELVFGFKPKEYDYVVSPFREDKTPGCYFEYSPNGELRFKDFANSSTYKGTRLSNMDCFDCVKVHFKLKNFYEVLRFVKKKLILGKGLVPLENREYKKSDSDIFLLKSDVKIYTVVRNFILNDKEFWYDRYEITRDNLIEDKTFPVSSFTIKNEIRKNSITVDVKELTYSYNGFDNDKKKIYRPFQTGKRRFFTNCNQNDIGGFYSLPPTGKRLIITKSYKDYRVLKNQGHHVIWFHNEGMFPTLDILLPLCNRFEEVVIFFDNDKAGIDAAKKLVGIINSYIPGKSKYIHLPILLLNEGIKDPSDMIHKKGRIQLLVYLNDRLL